MVLGGSNEGRTGTGTVRINKPSKSHLLPAHVLPRLNFGGNGDRWDGPCFHCCLVHRGRPCGVFGAVLRRPRRQRRVDGNSSRPCG